MQRCADTQPARCPPTVWLPLLIVLKPVVSFHAHLHSNARNIIAVLEASPIVVRLRYLQSVAR